MTETRTRFSDAYQGGDWGQVLELGKQLLAEGEYGNPRGQVPIRMAEAAGRLGQHYESVLYSDIARETVASGTQLDASVLCNCAYACRLHGAPGRTLEVGSIFLERYGSTGSAGYRYKGMVLIHMASAHEALKEWDAAASCFDQAIAFGRSEGNLPLAAMATVDRAYIELLRAGKAAVGTCLQMLGEVDPEHLDLRGRFAFRAVNALLLEQQGSFKESDEMAVSALSAASEVDEALVHERAVVLVLRARLAFLQGNIADGVLMGLEAAVAFEATNDLDRLHECEALLRKVLS